MVVNTGVGKEIYDFLKTKLEIPERVISMDILFRIDDEIQINCVYYPLAREEKSDES